MIYISLGSNIGDKLKFLKTASEEISKLYDTKIIRSSSIYKTEPWGKKNQDVFLNSVLEIDSGLTPELLLSGLKEIEIRLGRRNREKWAEREIDLDILFYHDLVVKSDKINIPHPEIQNRKFVLIPMYELNPEFVHPVLNVSIGYLLENSKDNSEVIKL